MQDERQDERPERARQQEEARREAQLGLGLVLAPALMCLAIMPFGDTLVGRNLNVGLVMVFAFGSINVMAIMLGG